MQHRNIAKMSDEELLTIAAGVVDEGANNDEPKTEHY
jgi:hypothetical protein